VFPTSFLRKFLVVMAAAAVLAACGSSKTNKGGNFSTKGLLLGVLVALPFAGYWATDPVFSPVTNLQAAIIPLFLMPVVTAYLALNFTGCTPCTSRTGVRTEIFRYIPVMVIIAGCGIAVAVLAGILWFLGVA
jgi:hypothetical protein